MGEVLVADHPAAGGDQWSGWRLPVGSDAAPWAQRDPHRRWRGGMAPWLLLLTLPLGFLAVALLGMAGVPEDYLGLPLTALCGGTRMVLEWW